MLGREELAELQEKFSESDDGAQANPLVVGRVGARHNATVALRLPVRLVRTPVNRVGVAETLLQRIDLVHKVCESYLRKRSAELLPLLVGQGNPHRFPTSDASPLRAEPGRSTGRAWCFLHKNPCCVRRIQLHHLPLVQARCQLRDGSGATVSSLQFLRGEFAVGGVREFLQEYVVLPNHCGAAVLLARIGLPVER